MHAQAKGGWRWLRALVVVGLAGLLGGCSTLCKLCGKPVPPEAKVAPPTEMTCGQDGTPERCVVRVSVWTEGDGCQFSFAPDGLKLSRRLGQGDRSRARIRFLLIDVNKQGFAWNRPYVNGIEFQAPDARGRWVRDASADEIFTVSITDSRPNELVVDSRNQSRQRGNEVATYNYVVRVRGAGRECISPDPFIQTGRLD